MSSDGFVWLNSLQRLGIALGLGRTRRLLRQMGRPHLAYPCAIVAGTNGKGSTAATLAAILQASGYRTGLYTSPPLVDERDRWTIENAMIPEPMLDACIAEVREASEAAGIVPTYFEALTLIAFLAFARARCDVVVLEVGLGGRLDATNVVKPLAALITPIGFDHTEFLGNTLRKIAAEKAGVIHRGTIVLTSNEDPAVLDVLARRAAKFGNPFHVVRPGGKPIATPLAGEFQQQNVALAIRAAEELATHFNLITKTTIARGVAETRWRGRLESVQAGGKQILIDGCHNAHAVAVVAPHVDRTLPRPRTLVFGMMRDKDIEEATGILFPLFERIITTDPYPPRSVSPEELAQRGRELGIDAVAESDPEVALELAMESDGKGLFVGGSLYLAGAAIAYFDRKYGQQQQ
ncbi:MAG TPA: folylpolyglutamate synthase/dihydrofolate synthase family protein [Thermoanaerobaculia bacterium]|jgi:dihydrofolate synthase/folylpolyglutamate synthase